MRIDRVINPHLAEAEVGLASDLALRHMSMGKQPESFLIMGFLPNATEIP